MCDRAAAFRSCSVRCEEEIVQVVE